MNEDGEEVFEFHQTIESYKMIVTIHNAIWPY